jgi:WD40 repeat protein
MLMLWEHSELSKAGGIVRLWRLALVIGAGLLAAVATTVLAVAVNAATGSNVSWFPAMQRSPLWWTAGSSMAVACTALLVWWAQRRYDAGLRDMVPAVQRPEPWVVGRPAEVGRVVAALRHGGTVGITTALHGAGGFGKTTVARMVRADRRILRRFGDRVYWVTVGRDAGRQSLVGLVNDLIARLEPDRPITFTDAGQAAEHLATVLGGRRAPRRLLILDDVWTEEQLAVFPVPDRCARLVTTRNASLAAGGRAPVRVDRLSQRQAYAVLSAGLPPLPPAVAAALIAETRRWALGLRLVNKILADRARIQLDVTVAAEDLLGRLRQGGALQLDHLSGAGTGKIDVGDPALRARTIHATIEASAGLLDAGQRARLADLAVFAEDETIPINLVAALWQATGGLDSDASYALCARLADLALLALTPSADGGTISLHDVIRDFLREELGNAQLRRLHLVLVDCVADGLPTAPAASGYGTVTAWWETSGQSRYVLDHLIEHLTEAHDTQRAEAVATDLRWVVARLERAGPAAPYADLSLIGTPLADRLRLQLLGQAAHLLAETDPPHSLIDILCSRVSGDPDWGPQARDLQTSRTQPALINRLPLPDLPNPALCRTLISDVGETLGMAISPDGTWLATAGHDGTARIWDAATGKQQAILAGHIGAVHGVASSPDGTWLATASSDGTVRTWDPVTGMQRAILTGHSNWVNAVAVAPDGSCLATASHDLTVRIWDAAARVQRVILIGHTGWVYGVAFSPDGAWLATVSGDRTARIWDAATGKQQAILTGHVGGVHGVAFSPDGTWLATASSDGTVRTWDAVTGEQRALLARHAGGASGVAFSPDGTWLATASSYGAVRIWDAETGEQCAVLVGHTGGVRGVLVAPDGTWLATVGGDRTVRTWDAVIAKQRATLTGHTDWVNAVAVAQGGAWFATASSDGTARIWDAVTGEQHAILAGHVGGVRGVAVAPDGSWLATVGSDGTLRIWDAATGEQRAVRTGHVGAVNAVAIAPDATWIATVGGDRTTRIWDAATGGQRASLTGHTAPVNGIAVAADGNWLVTVGGDRTVRVWDAMTGEQRAVLVGHTGGVHGVAVAPDCVRIATASHDGTLRIWDRLTGRSCAVMRVDGGLGDCKWSSCGQSLAATGEAGLYYFSVRT